jgi:hypothetical protein
MSGRHRQPHSTPNLIIGSIAATVGVSSVLAAAIVELVSPEPSAAATAPAPQVVEPPQPVTQQGTVIALSPNSLTAQSPDGLTQTFSITPSTEAITPVEVNDHVTVVGTKRGASVVATAVAEQSAVGPAGRPMEFGV